jgi:hypothetical protein
MDASHGYPNRYTLPSYTHDALDFSRRQIRLLYLYKGQTTDINCFITTFDLGSVPSYIALSYAWGERTALASICLNSSQYLVQKNLFDFLSAFRNEPANDRYLWIDQICINQTNIEERNHQVQQMRHIYESCVFVIAWLGQEPQDVRAAGQYQLDILLHNQYFTRLWIVQEVLLAPEVWLLCGNVWISGRNITQRVQTYTWGQSGIPNAAIALFSPAHGGLQHSTHPLRSLVACINRYSGNGCADLRDKVYGFLGLIEKANSDIDHGLVVDYNKSVAEVYCDTIRAVSAHSSQGMEAAEFNWWEQEKRIYAENLGRNMNLGGMWGGYVPACDQHRTSHFPQTSAMTRYELENTGGESAENPSNLPAVDLYGPSAAYVYSPVAAYAHSTSAARIYHSAAEHT